MSEHNLLETLELAGLRAPKILTLAITGACNLSCSHCWVDAGVTASAAHVPTATLRRLLEEFAALGGQGVRLTGGEPLCHPDWLELLNLARNLDFSSLTLQTNGMMFDDAGVAALRDLDFPGLVIQISLDGATAETHDAVRGAGAFDGVLQGIRRLVAAGLGPRVSLFFTEMRHNLEEIPALLQLAEQLAVGSLLTGTLVLCGRAGEASPLAAPEPDQYLRLLERFDAEVKFRELYAKLARVPALAWRCGDTDRVEACTFVENPYLTAQGRLYPCVLCHADPYSVTGVFEKSLACAFAEGVPAWSSLQKASNRRSQEIPQCQECSQRLSCAGGCLGRAWASCGDIMAADDRCSLRRAITTTGRKGPA
jgi:radical SAM protein with 4Fe4S-binding SPASM domain